MTTRSATTHRIAPSFAAPNDGDSRYGPATNRYIDVLVIANCVALENEIFLEHVLYNNSSMLQQLGHNLQDIVPTLAASPPAGWPRDAGDLGQPSQFDQSGAAHFCCTADSKASMSSRVARRTIDELWNRRNVEVLASAYAADFAFEGPTDRKFSGADSYRAFLGSIHSTFPRPGSSGRRGLLDGQ